MNVVEHGIWGVARVFDDKVALGLLGLGGGRGLGEPLSVHREREGERV